MVLPSNLNRLFTMGIVQILASADLPSSPRAARTALLSRNCLLSFIDQYQQPKRTPGWLNMADDRIRSDVEPSLGLKAGVNPDADALERQTHSLTSTQFATQ